jgi:Lon protease-like protein
MILPANPGFTPPGQRADLVDFVVARVLVCCACSTSWCRAGVKTIRAQGDNGRNPGDPDLSHGTVLYPRELLSAHLRAALPRHDQSMHPRRRAVRRVPDPAGLETGVPAVPFATGCSARIAEWDMPHLGLFHLVTHGERVFHILEQWTAKSGLVQAQVELDEPSPPLPLPAEFDSLALMLDKIIAKVGAERFPAPKQLDEAAWVAYRLAEVLPMETDIKQRLLEARDPLAALSEVRVFLASRQVVL